MNLKLKKLILLISLTFIFSIIGCEKEQEEHEENIDDVTIINDTILSDNGSYFPLAIDNYWTYSQENITYDDVIDEVDETTYEYDTILLEINGVEYFEDKEFYNLNNTNYHIQNEEYYIRIYNDYDSTAILQKFLDTNLEEGARWFTDTITTWVSIYEMEFKSSMGYKIIEKNMTVNISDTTYENVIKVAEYRYTNLSTDPVAQAEMFPHYKYYALGVGLIKVEFSGPFSSIKQELFEYEIK